MFYWEGFFMAYVSSFAYCDSLQQQKNSVGKTQIQIVNPLDELNLVAVPSAFSFAILCVITDLEIDKNHIINLDFITPHHKTITVARLPITASELSGTEKEVRNIRVGVDIRNCIFYEGGSYATKVYVDDELIGEYKIQVEVGETK